MIKVFTMLGAIFAGLSVGLGAFGAHALKARVEPRLLEVWQTGASYQMSHALALIAVAWLLSRAESGAAVVAGWAFVIGVVLFSGSLYAMTLTGVRALGAITPLGGVSFLIGWIAFILAATKL